MFTLGIGIENNFSSGSSWELNDLIEEFPIKDLLVTSRLVNDNVVSS